MPQTGDSLIVPCPWDTSSFDRGSHVASGLLVLRLPVAPVATKRHWQHEGAILGCSWLHCASGLVPAHGLVSCQWRGEPAMVGSA